MQRTEFRCFERLRVRWAEVDIQKVAFNAHYLAYADTALMAYWRALALPYEAGMQQLGGAVFLKKAELLYHASARMDDVLDVGLRCTHMGESSMAFACGIFRGDKLLVSLNLLYVWVDSATQAKHPLPPTLRAMMGHYEAGGDMLELRCGDWARLRAEAEPLRMAVFVDEQGIAPEEEIDDYDAQSLHAVAFNRLGQPLATGRLLPSEGGVAKLGRMAVLRALRGQHCGRRVLDALIEAARERGDEKIILHAQCSAQGFYAKSGFVPFGAVFDEVGIAHIAMQRCLRAEMESGAGVGAGAAVGAGPAPAPSMLNA